MLKFRALKQVPLNKNATWHEIKAGIDRCTKQIGQDYDKTHDKWEHEVKFKAEVHYSQSGGLVPELGWPLEVTISFRTDDKIWHYVNEGTPPHIITVKNAKALHFKDTYVPHTTPGSRISGRGGASGGDVFRRQVHHPGTKARDFDRLIAESRQKFFVSEMTSAIWKGLQAGGFTLK